MRDAPQSRSQTALLLAFLTALAATLGALFIGEVLGKMPCTLCWYQRIAMFPLVVILGVAVWRYDLTIPLPAALLASAGLGLAVWHSGLYAGIIPQTIVPCTKDGPSCTDAAAQTVMGLPLPYLSLAAFAVILACLSQMKGNRA
ncbi:MAG: disulfide bond formation protein [Rhodobacterales bacterium 65-51]|uniref:disulfide bond formation protein B n=1 Tax=uncultured Gemmobacter sp. TaxID=1095917 RepID=UPI000959E7A6|nr:disulfide bond formation protein B [uncultured Gemmobacter sp.]OJY28866.1 MAG: disulfide bond formation protein [Rhodobacterales bacterium 65-51]